MPNLLDVPPDQLSNLSLISFVGKMISNDESYFGPSEYINSFDFSGADYFFFHNNKST